MDSAFNACLFALDRLRTILLALAVIILLKAAWVMLAPAIGVS